MSAVDVAKVDICFVLASVLLSWACCIPWRAPRARSALCWASRGKDGRIPHSQFGRPIGALSSSFRGTSGSLNERSLNGSYPEIQILGMVVWMTCAVPAVLGLQHPHVGRSNWCVHLQTRPIRAPERRPWSSVNASGTHVPVHSHGAANGPMRSLGVFSRQCPKWLIKADSWQSRVRRRGEENLRG